MKKKLIVLTVLLVLSILIETFFVGYNFAIKKLYKRKHLTDNDTYEILNDDINYIEGDEYSALECKISPTHTYNVMLKLKDKNSDLYIRLIYNNKDKLMEKADKEQTSFRVYLTEPEEIENFKIVFPTGELDLNNIDRIIINSNVDYIQNVRFSMLNVAIYYGIFVLIYMLFLLYKFLINKNLKIEKVFLIISLSVGLILVFINVPLATYDEHAHFWRTYELANGIVKSETKELPDSVFDIVIDKETGIYHVEKNTSYDYISQKFSVPLDKNTKSNHLVGATGTVSPLSYIPQTIGVFIGNVLNLNPVFLVYLGRIFNLLSYIALIYIAIKITTSEKIKRIICLISILPMALNLAVSFSPDAIIMSCSILALAYILHLKSSNLKINYKNYLVFLVLVTIISMCKIVYLTFAFLLLLIPKENFKKNSYKILYVIFTILFIVLVYTSWQRVVTSSPVVIRTSQTEQLYYTLSDIKRDLGTGVNTLYKFTDEYYNTMIGGWNTPYSVIIIMSAMLFVATYREDDNKDNKELITKANKIILSLIILVSATLIFVGLYIAWTRTGFNYVEGVQGRYFLPLLLPAVLILGKNKLILKIKNENMKMLMLLFVLYIPVFINTIVRFS